MHTERQKDRKTERQIDRKTERQKDRKTERQKGRKTERQKDRKVGNLWYVGIGLEFVSFNTVIFSSISTHSMGPVL